MSIPRFLLLALTLLAASLDSTAAEVRVMISGGYAASHLALVPEFERATGHKVITIRGPSMGATAEAIPNRLQRGEPADVLIMVATALDGLIKGGQARADSRVDLAQSGIGMAVRRGATHPDIGSLAALTQTLLQAKSIAYSDSASGVYLAKELFPRLGIADKLKEKSRAILGEPVAAVVARGEAEIGFQQISELKPIEGVDLVGPLPAGAQLTTVFSGALAANAREPEAARALLRFLSSGAAVKVVTAAGMEPVSAPAVK